MYEVIAYDDRRVAFVRELTSRVIGNNRGFGVSRSSRYQRTYEGLTERLPCSTTTGDYDTIVHAKASDTLAIATDYLGTPHSTVVDIASIDAVGANDRKSKCRSIGKEQVHLYRSTNR